MGGINNMGIKWWDTKISGSNSTYNPIDSYETEAEIKAFKEGVEFGRDDGYENGYERGKKDGYHEGYNDCLKQHGP